MDTVSEVELGIALSRKYQRLRCDRLWRNPGARAAFEATFGFSEKDSDRAVYQNTFNIWALGAVWALWE